MSDDAFKFIMIAGGVAKAAGKGIDESPYSAWTPEWLAWRYGFNGLFFGRNQKGPVPRETKSGGRGRSVLGPRREWSADEMRALEACDRAEMSEGLIAAVMGRSYPAVKVKLCRLRKVAA